MIVPPPVAPSPRRAIVRALVAALAAVVVAFAPAAATGAPGQPPPRRVVVVGDSVILGARAEVTGAFQSAGWAVTFDADVSRSTLAGAGAVNSHREELTDSLVVNLGANDGGNPVTFRQRVDQLLASVQDVPRVYWLTIREVRDYYPAANQVLRDAAARYPNVTVLDWNAATAGSSGLTSGDGLHLTGQGARAMAFFVASNVMAGPVPAAPATTTTAAPAPAPTTPPAPAPGPPATTAAASTTTTTTKRTTTTEDPGPPTTRWSVVPGGPSEGVRDLERVATDEADVSGGLGWSLVLVLLVLAVAGGALATWALVRTSGRSEPAWHWSAAAPDATAGPPDASSAAAPDPGGSVGEDPPEPDPQQTAQQS